MSVATCERCGDSFVRADRGNGKNKRFCSDNCRKRACDTAKTAPCPRCGADMGPRSGFPGVERSKCWDCEMEARHRKRDHRLVIAAARIKPLWDAGLHLTEIADELGWTIERLGSTMFDLRASGVDLPYRYQTHPRRVA